LNVESKELKLVATIENASEATVFFIARALGAHIAKPGELQGQMFIEQGVSGRSSIICPREAGAKFAAEVLYNPLLALRRPTPMITRMSDVSPEGWLLPCAPEKWKEGCGVLLSHEDSLVRMTSQKTVSGLDLPENLWQLQVFSNNKYSEVNTIVAGAVALFSPDTNVVTETLELIKRSKSLSPKIQRRLASFVGAKGYLGIKTGELV